MRAHAPGGIGSLAVIPFEDDSADGATDGFGRAAAHLLQWQLDGAPNLYVFAANPNSAAAEHAGRVLHGWYMRRNTEVEVHITLQDTEPLRTVSIRVYHGDRAAVLNGIARSIRPEARAFSASDDASIGQFGRALTTTAATGQVAFVPEVLSVSQLLMDGGHSRDAAELLKRAEPAFEHASPLDQARRSWGLALAAGDPAAERNALEAVVRLAPADPASRRALADLLFSERDWAGAEAGFSVLARTQPWNGSVLNTLGYVRMYRHDAAGARAAIAQYAHASPQQSANAADSLGEIDWDFGDFHGAERNFLESSRGDILLLRGNDVLKAAEARFMQGDRAGADALFQKYASWRASGPDALVPVRQAQWLYITGRSQTAESALAAAAGKLQADAQAVALAQLSFWTLLENRRPEALELARRAATVALSPAGRDLAAICAFYAAPSTTVAEWRERGRGLPDEVVGSALELDDHHSDAIGLLSQALAAAPPPEDGDIRGMLIRTYLALGNTSQATRLLWPMPLAFYNGDPIFDAAWFPQWRRWQAITSARTPNQP